MPCTRSTSSKLISPLDDCDAPACVRKLLGGGAGGRREVCPSRGGQSGSSSNLSSDQNDRPTDYTMPHPSSPDVAHVPSGRAPASPPNIIINLNTLQRTINENFSCRHCSLRDNQLVIDDFLNFCDMQPFGFKVRTFWKRYHCQQSRKGKRTFDMKELSLTAKSHGLATILTINCTHRHSHRHDHVTICNPEMTICKEAGRTTRTSRYALNLKVVMAAMLNGGSHNDIMRFTKLLGLPWVTSKTYREIEQTLGSCLKKIVSNQCQKHWN